MNTNQKEENYNEYQMQSTREINEIDVVAQIDALIVQIENAYNIHSNNDSKSI